MARVRPFCLWWLQVTEASRRQRASRISKHVTLYWAKIDKLTIYKHRSQLDAQRREAMDRHLTFLVNQTERYSSRLTVPAAQVQVRGALCMPWWVCVACA
jgi:hypothetical protein